MTSLDLLRRGIGQGLNFPENVSIIGRVEGAGISSEHGESLIPPAGLSLSELSFCGKNLQIPEIEMAILSDDWESTVILSKISPLNTSLALAQDPGFRAIIRNDTASEYDAENLCQYLEKRQAEGSMCISGEFLKFEKAWRRDEMNHTLGFAMIEALLFSASVSEILTEIRSESPNFTPLVERGLFDDEFTTAVVIAYDEISTARAYAEDWKTRYPKFENPVILEWIKKVAADESRHFYNIISVIKRCHAERIPEIPSVLKRILEWERSEHEYGRTFVLDHTGEQFTGVFINKAASILLKQFNFSLADI